MIPQLSPNMWMLAFMFGLLMFTMMCFCFSLFNINVIVLDGEEIFDKSVVWLW